VARFSMKSEQQMSNIVDIKLQSPKQSTFMQF